MDKLPVGAIIGIVVGLVAIIALAILLCWCCRTGYIANFMEEGGGGGTSAWKAAGVTAERSGTVYRGGSIDSNLEKLSTTSSTQQLKNGINYEVTSVVLCCYHCEYADISSSISIRAFIIISGTSSSIY